MGPIFPSRRQWFVKFVLHKYVCPLQQNNDDAFTSRRVLIDQVESPLAV